MGIIMKIGSSGKESFDNFDIGQMKVGAKTTIIEDGKIVHETKEEEQVEEIINEEINDEGIEVLETEEVEVEGVGEVVTKKSTRKETNKNK